MPRISVFSMSAVRLGPLCNAASDTSRGMVRRASARPPTSCPAATTQTWTGAIRAAARPAPAVVMIEPVVATASAHPVTVASSAPSRSRSPATSALATGAEPAASRAARTGAVNGPRSSARATARAAPSACTTAAGTRSAGHRSQVPETASSSAANRV